MIRQRAMMRRKELKIRGSCQWLRIPLSGTDFRLWANNECIEVYATHAFRLGKVNLDKPVLSEGKKMKSLKHVPVLLLLLVPFCISASAQDRVRMISASLSDDHSLVKRVTDPTYIPGGSKVYVADINGLPGFENNLVAAFQKKRVDLIVVTDRSQADFEINGFAESQKAGWAKIIFRNGLPESEASMQMVNLHSGVVAYAVASYKVEARNGNKSTAEHLAKNLRQKMERDEKRIH
jgi:hypothetical protein